MDKVRWGVLGTADIARGATIPGMQQAENCELFAVAGRSLEKAQAFRDAFGFRKAYGSYEELLADPEVEAVYIPLPNDLHCAWSIRALQAGKHVLCEKPLAVSEAQVKEMFAAAEANGVFLMEAFAYLHSPFVQAVKSELEAGTIGDIRYMESAFITGRRPDTDIRLRKETYGGAMYDLGCYAVSMAMWMIGKEPDTVRASAQFSEKGIDLFTSALLLYDDESVAALDCGMLLPHGRLDRFRIFGTKGTIVSPVEFNQGGDIPYTVTRDGVSETKTVSVRNNYTLEVEQLGRCVRGLENPHVSREFSLLVARVTDRILEAIGY
ncbi:MAG: Gfo/Idh/MocA family oxidoreductase [Clostridia bacterium]|nr:Gfo/Idh/MocA family oxidoreductase [Clostridia bacterium]